MDLEYCLLVSDGTPRLIQYLEEEVNFFKGERTESESGDKGFYFIEGGRESISSRKRGFHCKRRGKTSFSRSYKRALNDFALCCHHKKWCQRDKLFLGARGENRFETREFEKLVFNNPRQMCSRSMYDLRSGLTRELRYEARLCDHLTLTISRAVDTLPWNNYF